MSTGEGGEAPNGPTRYEFDWETGRRRRYPVNRPPFIDPAPLGDPPLDSSVCTAGPVPHRGRHYSWELQSFRWCRIHDRVIEPDFHSELLWIEFDATPAWAKEK